MDMKSGLRCHFNDKCFDRMFWHYLDMLNLSRLITQSAYLSSGNVLKRDKNCEDYKYSSQNLSMQYWNNKDENNLANLFSLISLDFSPYL